MIDQKAETPEYLTDELLFQHYPLIVELRPIKLPDGSHTSPRSYRVKGTVYLSSSDLARWREWKKLEIEKGAAP